MDTPITENNIPDTYGISPETPLLTSGVIESLAILDDLITYDHQYILYHRFGSFFSSIAGHPIDIYHLCSGDGERYDIYVDIYNEKTLWIPPVGFKFISPFIQYYDVNGKLKYQFTGEKNSVDVRPKRKRWGDNTEIVLDTDDPESYQILLTSSFGVNTYIDDFPKSLIEKYLFEESDIKDILTQDQLKQRKTYYKNRRKEFNRFQWKHSSFRLFLLSIKYKVQSFLFPSVPPMPY